MRCINRRADTSPPIGSILDALVAATTLFGKLKKLIQSQMAASGVQGPAIRRKTIDGTNLDKRLGSSSGWERVRQSREGVSQGAPLSFCRLHGIAKL